MRPRRALPSLPPERCASRSPARRRACGPAAGRVLLLLAFLAALTAGSGCVQEVSVAPEVAVVTGDLEMDPSLGEANIRVDIAGTAPSRVNNSRDLILTDFGYTDEEGRFQVRTANRGENYFAVARHHRYDIEVGPLPILEIGETAEWTEMFPIPTTALDDPLPRLAPGMTPKVPGRVKFVFVATETAFTGEDEGPGIVEIAVLGDFNNFSRTSGLVRLFDDGSQFEQSDPDGNFFISGDAEANDGVFVGFLEGLPPGNLRYNFFLNNAVVIRDPFEEGYEVMVDEDNLRVTRSVVRVY